MLMRRKTTKPPPVDQQVALSIAHKTFGTFTIFSSDFQFNKP